MAAESASATQPRERANRQGIWWLVIAALSLSLFVGELTLGAYERAASIAAHWGHATIPNGMQYELFAQSFTSINSLLIDSAFGLGLLFLALGKL
jgi:hypothetical protein